MTQNKPNKTNDDVIMVTDETGVQLYEDAIQEGRRQGFVEADPSMDVDGWDAAAKLTALMNVLIDEHITPLEIDRTGIREITKAQLDEAAARGSGSSCCATGRPQMERHGGR